MIHTARFQDLRQRHRNLDRWRCRKNSTWEHTRDREPQARSHLHRLVLDNCQSDSTWKRPQLPGWFNMKMKVLSTNNWVSTWKQYKVKEYWPWTHTTQKVYWRQITDLNVEAKTVRFIEENLREKAVWLWSREKDFLEHKKHELWKEKDWLNWILSKLELLLLERFSDENNKISHRWKHARTHKTKTKNNFLSL